jgi:hypothetical protein
MPGVHRPNTGPGGVPSCPRDGMHVPKEIPCVDNIAVVPDSYPWWAYVLAGAVGVKVFEHAVFPDDEDEE